jgi:RimJ/RimL family protein N-acetyltransferase
MKAYEAAGFVREGILRQAVYKNGRYLDIIVMSVLHSEWKGL